jgi:hypothetical protein
VKTRYFALVVGIIYLVVGIAGFIPAFGTERTTPELAVEANYQNLFGLFPVNVLHNLVHLLIGALGVLAYMSFDAARNYSRGLAIVYAVLAIMGLIDAGDLNTTFELIPLFSHDIWLHALTALAAGYFGFGNVEAGETSERATAV